MRPLAAFLCALACAAQPLILTPYVNSGNTKEARALAAVEYEGINMGYSAFFAVPSTSEMNTNNIYFWFQPCLQGCNPATAPFVMWFQGGPGAPGTFGALSEIGNWYIDENLAVQENPYSWCLTYNCLFVDQPTMTGFSYQVNSTGQFNPDNIEYTQTSAEAMEQVWLLLEQFYQVFPEYLPAPFYITGESYGGLYTPNMAYTIWQHNQAGDMQIALTGLAVGDPIINAQYQWPTYGATLHGMGVIMSYEQTQIDDIMAKGVALLDVNCTQAFDYWNSVWNDNGGGGYPGLYYQLTGSSMTENVLLGAEPAGFNYGPQWLVQPSVAKAFHYAGTPANNFAEGGLVYSTMVNSGDFCSNSSWLYATLFLVGKIDLMIYSSTSDPLLGPPTTEAGVQATWDYAAASLAGGAAAQTAYNNAQKVVWRIQSTDVEPAGYARCFEGSAGNNFCYTVVRNGGHELPAFQPASAYDMFMRFVARRPFDASGNFPTPPTAAQCSGVPPFAGSALPECVCPPA